MVVASRLLFQLHKMRLDFVLEDDVMLHEEESDRRYPCTFFPIYIHMMMSTWNIRVVEECRRFISVIITTRQYKHNVQEFVPQERKNKTFSEFEI
jgi:hypothetical protein